MVTGFLNEKQDRLFDTSNRLEQAEKEVSEAERQLSGTKMELAETEKDLIQIKTESRETKQTLLAEQEEIKQENLSLKTDTLTLHFPVVREFVKLVEEKKNIWAAAPYGYTSFGRLLKEYRTPLLQYERLVIFPEIASWQTSKGEVIPVYEDYNRRGTDYKLAGFWNV